MYYYTIVSDLLPFPKKRKREEGKQSMKSKDIGSSPDPSSVNYFPLMIVKLKSVLQFLH